MSKIHCQLIVNSNARHLHTVLTGFKMLQLQNKIELSQHLPGNSFLLNGKRLPVEQYVGNEMHLDVIVNKTICVHYDVSDSKNIDEAALARCDFYYKRSFNEEHISPTYQTEKHKIMPFGLYFFAINNEFDNLALKRDLFFSSNSEKLKSIFRHLDRNNLKSYTPYLRFFERQPQLSASPKVLFMTKVWDPVSDKDYPLTAYDQSNRVEINNFRTNCIREMKKAFGSQFTGGIERSSYADKYCPELVIKDTTITRRANYLKLMQEHDVCVSTSGLHDSIGGKFAEYLAASKAIVSEHLVHKLPGNLQKNKHYLEFDSVESCIKSTEKLLSDNAFRQQMMIDNEIYYQEYVRPDNQVFQSLSSALHNVQ